MSEKKNYVIDTSVFLTDAECLYKFNENNIFIPLKVLEEIDNHKKRQDSVGGNARRIIRILDELRETGSLQHGVTLGDGLGRLQVMSYECLNEAIFPPDLDVHIPDHIIIATAMAVKSRYPEKQMTVVSRDINMRVICDSVGLPAEDYTSELAAVSSEQLYRGHSEHFVDDEVIDRFYSGDDIYIEDIPDTEVGGIYPNHYFLLRSNISSQKTALTRLIEYHLPLRKIIHDRVPDWNIEPRNKEQTFAIDLLLDPEVKLITLVGTAGSGKTLVSLAAGLQKTIGLRDNQYDRLIVSRPVQPLGKDIGFLPGDLKEKMLPWLMPIQDNLQYLVGDKNALELYMEKGKIELEAITYIRGRSIANSYIVVDEAQNLTKHEVKTIITRVGENTKIILTGDIEQIDNVYVNETSNGLAHAIEKFKDYPLAGHVTFTKGERSALASLATKVL